MRRDEIDFIRQCNDSVLERAKHRIEEEQMLRREES